MTFHLQGITNENSFFSEHYLATLFEDHMRDSLRQEGLKEGNEISRAECGRLFNRSRHAHERANDDYAAQARGEFQIALLKALGYERRRENRVMEFKGRTVVIPVLARAYTADGADALWIIDVREGRGADGWGADPLELPFDSSLYPADEIPLPSPEWTAGKVAYEGVFNQTKPPRWLLLMSLAHVVLLDRLKMADERRLRFDLESILASPRHASWDALRCLLHRKALTPYGAARGIDRFDDESRRHARGVSQDLKFALREAIELIGNEAATQSPRLRARSSQDAEILTRECLRYMYRILFLFYVEAKTSLGHDYVRSNVYMDGYSLEALRALELRRLSPDSEDTFFIHESLQTLFRFLREGTPLWDKPLLEAHIPTHHDFVIKPIGAHLFDEAETPVLNAVRLPDRVLRRVVELLSLSRPGTKGRGRISYAQLGVNQLGAVYEALLSFTGFFAQEDLIEVKKAGKEIHELERAWFAPLSMADQYRPEEIAYEDQKPKIYEKGRFIYRMTGFGREATASYYTPEELTHCTVKHALDELLKDRNSDQILDIRICEPAMGSAAFLIEAVNQLADTYLQRKQQETGRTWDETVLNQLRQRVRAYITARNAFGVDLNPEAKALGEISLWLNSMGNSGFLPDFQHTLYVGNSLIGCRREVVTFTKKTGSKRTVFVAEEETRRLGANAPRAETDIYHFLVPVPTMLEYKLAKSEAWLIEPEVKASIQKWRRNVSRPWTEREMRVLQGLSTVVDELWRESAAKQTQWRVRYDATLPTAESLYNINISYARMNTGYSFYSKSIARRSLAMDFWCSLWFWPFDVLDRLPGRSQCLEIISLILTGRSTAWMTGELDWVQDAELMTVEEQSMHSLLEQYQEGVPFEELELVLEDWLEPIERIAKRKRFFHWDLEFADIFAVAGGFDLVIGNPPWIALEWKDSELLAQFAPEIILQNLSADQVAKHKKAILNTEDKRAQWIFAFRDMAGRTAFFKHPWQYPDMAGVPNTYKAFLLQGFHLVRSSGVAGFIHPIDHLKDPKGRALRKACFQRQIWLLQFSNTQRLFADIHAMVTFGIGIYVGEKRPPQFRLMANLLDPQTVTESLRHDGAGPVPELGDIRSHRNRVVHVNLQTLERLGSVLDPGVSALEMRLPLLHAQELVDSLIKITRVPDRLDDLEGRILQDRMWDETGDRKPPNPVFQRRTDFYDNPREMILQGPIFGLSNPWAKCPRPNCKSSNDNDVIDLTIIPEDYLPRVNYTPVIPWEAYRQKVRKVPWDSGKRHLDFHRLFLRQYVNAGNERLLQCAIFGEAFGHVHVAESLSVQDTATLVQVCTLWNALPYDFIPRSFFVTHIFWSFTSQLPLVDLPDTALHRTLQLNCLTTHNSALWDELAHKYSPLAWSGTHSCLEKEGPQRGTRNWSRHCALRSDFARRQALLEIDVMVAIALDLSLHELLQIYRLVFPVMRKYEENTWYDQHGRIVWSPIVGKGMKMPRSDWEKMRSMPEGVLTEEVQDNFLPGGPHHRTIEYRAPFTRPDREQNYRRAWEYFAQRL